MKIQTIGTGGIFTNAVSACALVDGKLLVDCPNGAVKALRRQGVDLQAIDLCLITHFHGDHYFDLPFLLLELSLQERNREFQIIGPAGMFIKAKTLMQEAYEGHWEEAAESVSLTVNEVIPAEPDQTGKPYYDYFDDSDVHHFETYGYKIISYPVKHGDRQALGYVVTSHDDKK